MLSLALLIWLYALMMSREQDCSDTVRECNLAMTLAVMMNATTKSKLVMDLSNEAAEDWESAFHSALVPVLIASKVATTYSYRATNVTNEVLRATHLVLHRSTSLVTVGLLSPSLMTDSSLPCRFGEYLKKIEISSKVLHMFEMEVILLAATTHKLRQWLEQWMYRAFGYCYAMTTAHPESLPAMFPAPS